MMRSRASETGLVAALGLAALPLSGCAFGEGEVWAEARVALSARVDPAERLDAEGQWRTAESFGLRLDSISISVRRVELDREADATPAGFDPASPPPGFSLCHNGHCHADDGRLVPYAEVAAGSGAEAAPPALSVEAEPGWIALDAAARPVPLAACPSGCVLDHGALREAAVELSGIALRGRAFDRTVAGGRLPPEGADFALELPLSARVAAPIDVPIDSSEPVGAALNLGLVLGPRSLDGLDFARLAEPGLTTSSTAAAAVAEQLVDHARLELVLERFDP
jgi:hypothetical protein